MTPSLVTCAMQSDMQDYYDRLLYWQEHTDQTERDWAVFLLDDTKPNKEKLLQEKKAWKNP